MRFDSTPYYHVGEDYDWETLVDEMRKRFASWTRVDSQAPGSPSITSTGMAGTAPSPTPSSRSRPY